MTRGLQDHNPVFPLRVSVFTKSAFMVTLQNTTSINNENRLYFPCVGGSRWGPINNYLPTCLNSRLLRNLTKEITDRGQNRIFPEKVNNRQMAFLLLNPLAPGGTEPVWKRKESGFVCHGFLLAKSPCTEVSPGRSRHRQGKTEALPLLGGVRSQLCQAPPPKQLIHTNTRLVG